MHTLRVQGYFRHNDCTYRIQVFDDDQVRVERQDPSAFAGNMQMPIGADDILHGIFQTWKLEAIAPLLDKYEKLYNEGT